MWWIIKEYSCIENEQNEIRNRYSCSKLFLKESQVYLVDRKVQNRKIRELFKAGFSACLWAFENADIEFFYDKFHLQVYWLFNINIERFLA